MPILRKAHFPSSLGMFQVKIGMTHIVKSMEEKPGCTDKGRSTYLLFYPSAQLGCKLDFPGASPDVIFKSFERFPTTKGTMRGVQAYRSMVTPDVFVQVCLAISFCTQRIVRSAN